MSRRISHIAGVSILVTVVAFIATSTSRAGSVERPEFAGSPFDLVNVVNALRASYGLAPYSINSILMYTAQAQADFLAATGSMSHTGPGGSSVTDRLLAAGYPLAGDLSLGGFLSENITGGSESMTAEEAVNRWTGDAPHLNTMVSTDLTEIGAGVAISGGRVYYVIDCAQPTGSGVPQTRTTQVGSGSAVPVIETVIMPVSVVTPDAEGNVIHEVRAGQSLWQIAIAYNVKIDEIKGLNNLFDNNIYPGNTLLIKRGAVQLTASPAETPTQQVTQTFTSALTSTATERELTPTSTQIIISSSMLTNNAAIVRVVIGIMVVAFLGGGIFTWLGSPKKQ
jgi:uncharacterized protein YkwD